jgi:hypothetical protein
VVREVLMVLGVLLLPVPALVAGARGLLRRSGRSSSDPRAERIRFGLLVTGRSLALVLLLALSGVTLLSCVGGLIKGLTLPSLVYVFFLADLLVAVPVLLTSGRPDRRRARRRATPGRR